MWIAWLSWRLPPGSRRWRSVRPEETGIGAQPEMRASWASLVNRSIAGDHVACDLHLDGARRSPQALRDLGLPGLLDQDALGDLPVWPEVVQLPAQLVDQPGPGVHQPLTMQSQQPDLELDAGQPSGRERVDSLAQRRTGDRQRVDRVRLPPLADVLAGVGHQPGREPHDGLAAIDQEPLQAAGHVPNVLGLTPVPWTHSELTVSE